MAFLSGGKLLPVKTIMQILSNRPIHALLCAHWPAVISINFSTTSQIRPLIADSFEKSWCKTNNVLCATAWSNQMEQVSVFVFQRRRTLVGRNLVQILSTPSRMTPTQTTKFKGALCGLAAQCLNCEAALNLFWLPFFFFFHHADVAAAIFWGVYNPHVAMALVL